ncbi:zinc-dependent peptidase [Cyclobacteriaceae bacterium]|nr:zinc-dependent peptidase [Cyclobacteriaceae bacterium]
MTAILITLGTVALFVVQQQIAKKKKRKELLNKQFNPEWKAFLENNVVYYRSLSPNKKHLFEQWVHLFLYEKKITAVHTTITDHDKLLIASSAIIPVFAFPYYTYPNLNEILIYPHHFDANYSLEGDGRNILGMVGTGPMEGKMILAQTALRHGFSNANDKHNVGIHEFIHLIDKQDGDTDGIPKLLIDHQLSIPWVEIVHQETERIFNQKSDINPYGATNRAEFLAVIGEYFFESPEILKKKHPKLYKDLVQVFHQEPNLKAFK